MAEKKRLAVRGYLIHMTHYDPAWFDRKAQEKPFDLKVGLEIVKGLGAAGFNTLIIDLADGVKYARFPELKRPYTVGREVLEELIACARGEGLEIMPKLNFSKGPTPRSSHNEWFRPFAELEDTPTFWKNAWKIIDEAIEMTKPEGGFFIGMDEDFLRTPAEYVAAVNTLHGGLKKRGLRTVMWNDTTHTSSSFFQCVEKTMAAEASCSKEVVHVVWNYRKLLPRAAARVRQMVKSGLEVWIAPGRDVNEVTEWKQFALQAGCPGMVMTAWRPVEPAGREAFMQLIETVGPIYSSETEVPKEELGSGDVTAVRVTQANMKKRTRGIKEEITAPNRLGEALKETPYLLPSEVYVREWMVLGPYPFDKDGYGEGLPAGVNDETTFVGVEEGTLAAGPEGTEAHGKIWRKFTPAEGTRFPQVIDLVKLYGPNDFAVAYLVAHVHSEKAVKGYNLYLGSDDYAKVWVNGELVHSWAEGPRAIAQDEDKVEGIALAKGWNKIVVKCVNLKATWGMILRVADEKDRPLVVR